MFPHSVLHNPFSLARRSGGKEAEKKYGQQLPRVYFGLYGVLETSWRLKTRLSQPRGLKLTLYLIYGLGLTCLAMLTQTLS